MAAELRSLYPRHFSSAPGRLFAWGSARPAETLPVAASAIDKSGDVAYPAECVAFPEKKLRFLKASVDMAPFAALDSSDRLWCWSARAKKDWSASPRVELTDCADCAAGDGFVAAVKADGSVWARGRGFQAEWAEVGWAGEEGRAARRAAVIDACAGVVLVATVDGELLRRTASAKLLEPLEGLPPVASFAVGSIHYACAGRDGTLWTWGDGLSGNLGSGSRASCALPTQVTLGDGSDEQRVVHVACTRSQAMPKRLPHAFPKQLPKSFESGQEGPRCHAVTADGGLWIAGAAHKGLGADHVSKTLHTTGSDHLSFYRVGGAVQSAQTEGARTGAAELIASEPQLTAARMGMASAELLGAGGRTHYLDAVRVASSGAASIHSVALSEEGELFAWGCGSNGRTGLRAFMGGPHGAKRTLKCYVSTPSRVEALEGACVLHVATGRYWTLCIVAD